MLCPIGFAKDKLPEFILANRCTGEHYVIPAKAVNESTIRVLLVDNQQRSLSVYFDCFCAYDLLDKFNEFTRNDVI